MPTRAERHQAFVDFMIPIVKGCSTETAQEVASLGVQVHGGMGFIEETGAAQHYRDARITTIYEGTTGIQANDFIGRKTARDGGAVARGIADEMEKRRAGARGPCRRQPEGDRRAARGRRRAPRAAADWMVPAYGTNPRAAHAVAVPYLKLWGLVARRLAARPRARSRRRGSSRTAPAMRSFLHGEDRDGALLRRGAVAPGGEPRASGDGSRRVGAGPRRRAILSR